MAQRAACLLVLAIAGALFAATPPQDTQNQWKEYSYASDGFAVSAPEQPGFIKQDKPTASGTVEVHNYSIELGNNSGVMISATQYPAQPKDSPKTILQSAKNGAIGAVNAKLISEKEITLNDFPGLEFEAATDDFHMRVRMYLAKTRLITMMAIAPKDSTIPATADRVFSSFKLLPPAK